MQTVHHAPHDLGVAKLVAALRQGELSALETAQHFLKRAQAQADSGRLSGASTRRSRSPRRAPPTLALAAGTAGPLEGVPLAHKDIFVTRDLPQHGRFEDVERLPVAV
jgi:aspartyl-tRNA(Asn)/glutamyl-tRNA(Gln) amidotransferase subunit A